MLKVNLMNLPDDEDQPKKPEQNIPEVPTVTDRKKMDFSFFDPDEEPVAETITETPASPPEEPLRQEENPFSVAEEDLSEEEPDYDSAFPKTRLFVFIGIGVVLILGALFLIYKLYRPGTTEAPAAGQNIERPASTGENLTTPPPPAIPPALQSRYRQNMARNTEGLRFTRGFLNSGAKNTDHTLIVYTSDQILTSVLANSRDDIARYRQAVKSRFPNLQLNIETVEDKFVNGRKKLLAGFSIPIKPGRGGSAPVPSASPLTFQEFQSQLRALQKKYGIKTAYRKVGERRRERSLNITYFYTTLTGSRTAIMNFLKEVTQRFPGMKINKLSIYPNGATSLSQGRVNARLEISYFAPQS